MGSKEWRSGSEVREEGKDCSHAIGRVGRDNKKSVLEVLQVLDFELSPSMHATAAKAISRNSGSSFLMEQVGEAGSKPSMSPGEALDGPLGFSLPKTRQRMTHALPKWA